MRISEEPFVILSSEEDSRPNAPVNVLIGADRLKTGFSRSLAPCYVPYDIGGARPKFLVLAFASASFCPHHQADAWCFAQAYMAGVGETSCGEPAGDFIGRISLSVKVNELVQPLECGEGCSK